MAELSPAAQAVLDAYGDFEPANVDALAAALRAATDQVLPESFMNTPQLRARYRSIRHLYLAIATELQNYGEATMDLNTLENISD